MKMLFKLLLLGSATVVIAGELKALLPSRTQNFTVPAEHTHETPSLPAHAARKPLALLFASDGCATPPASPASINRPFVLMVRRGNCTFDDKMTFAIAAGATALIVADTLASQYQPANASTGWSVRSMALRDPCAVSCDIGRGVVDTAGIDVTTVLAGLAGRCDTAARDDQLSCPTGLCALSAPPSKGSSERQVCCALQTPALQMAFPHTLNTSAATVVPAVYLSLTYGQRLEAECSGNGKSHSVRGSGGALSISSCDVWLADDDPIDAAAHHTRWDGSAAIVWLFATGTAALAAYLAAYSHDSEDREVTRATAPRCRVHTVHAPTLRAVTPSTLPPSSPSLVRRLRALDYPLPPRSRTRPSMPRRLLASLCLRRHSSSRSTLCCARGSTSSLSF